MQAGKYLCKRLSLAIAPLTGRGDFLHKNFCFTLAAIKKSISYYAAVQAVS
jgi:hypothetical protein